MHRTIQYVREVMEDIHGPAKLKGTSFLRQMDQLLLTLLLQYLKGCEL